MQLKMDRLELLEHQSAIQLSRTYVMWKICIHQDDIVARAGSESLDVGASEAKFTRACMQLKLVAINFLQLLDDVLGSIGWVIVYNHNFHVDIWFLGGLE